MKLSTDTRALALLATVGNFCTEQGIQAYITGGFVRDMLLGRETADIDIAVTADALEIAPRLATVLGGKYVLLDEVNIVGRIIMADQGAPSANRVWQIDITTVSGDIENDLGQRDFTVDAMAIDLAELGKDHVHLIDPFRGQDDLREGRIRVVAKTAFTADAIRLLRGVRLAAELGFSLDSGTELLIKSYSHLITGVAAERIREELVRLLAISGRFLHYLDRLGLLTAIIPELAQLKGVEQPPEHFWDVFDHSLETVTAVDFLLREGSWEYADDKVLAMTFWSEALAEHFALEVSHGSSRRSLLRLAALLHDVAKPQTRATDENGRLRFLGHAQQGAETAVDILERLRFSSREVKLVELEVRHHLRPGQMSQEWLPTRRAIYRYFRDSADAGVDTLFLSLADHLATRGSNLNLINWQEHAKMVEYVLSQHEQQETTPPPRLISGHDLINILGMSPGPRIGELLESVREAQAAGELVTRDEALSYIRKQLLTKAGDKHA